MKFFIAWFLAVFALIKLSPDEPKFYHTVMAYGLLILFFWYLLR